MNKPVVKSLVVVAGALALFGAGVLTGANTFGTPKSVLHVITVKWKTDATAEQKAAAIDGVKKMASEVPGLKNVWLKPLKVQPREYNHVIVMEFEDQAAFDKYADHPAHRAWEKSYLAIREESRTQDVTN